MFDNVCKYLAETFSEDYATWLLGKPIALTALTTASAIFGGLKVKPNLIKIILRSDIMKESAFYQEILQEGEQRGLLKGAQEGEQQGLLKGKLEVAQRLLERGLGTAEVISLTGLTPEDLQTLSFSQDS